MIEKFVATVVFPRKIGGKTKVAHFIRRNSEVYAPVAMLCGFGSQVNAE